MSLITTQQNGPSPEFLNQQDWDGDLRICFANKFPDDTLKLVWKSPSEGGIEDGSVLYKAPSSPGMNPMNAT